MTLHLHTTRRRPFAARCGQGARVVVSVSLSAAWLPVMGGVVAAHSMVTIPSLPGESSA